MDLDKLLKDLVISDDPEKIKNTANALKEMRYSPILLSDFEDFLTVDSSRFFPEVESLLNSPDLPGEFLPPGETQESFREKKVSILIYHYKLLNRLRRGEPEAWDEVYELMEDD
ncbi:hypothetical protein EXM22_09610 [Oceanispirochaeta crateris]|uniref:Uncharacterized protein n=1 Tax=Oceanispirochaeta crateris TaxID=2518645 RepID=A0A5C1QKV5_9SPIO|nr:hypothetical protein [Oceanispirochaeta crateris]QEN08231.1 hypothetical protein EXM22_09610 [Oceanispirochaeta crateris]